MLLCNFTRRGEGRDSDRAGCDPEIPLTKHKTLDVLFEIKVEKLWTDDRIAMRYQTFNACDN